MLLLSCDMLSAASASTSSSSTQPQPPPPSLPSRPDFDGMLYGYTGRVEMASDKIIDFYEEFLTKKLQLASQHIAQIAQLKHLHKQIGVTRVERNSGATVVAEANQSQSSSLSVQEEPAKRRFRSSRKKLQIAAPRIESHHHHSLLRLSDLSNDLLRLDLELFDDDDSFQHAPRKKSSIKMVSSSQAMEGEFYNALDSQSHQPRNFEPHAHQSPSTMSDHHRKSKKVQLNEDNNYHRSSSGANKKKQQQQKQYSKGRTIYRKSLMDQFSEIKIQPKQEIKAAKEQLQYQLDMIDIDQVRHSTVNDKNNLHRSFQLLCDGDDDEDDVLMLGNPRLIDEIQLITPNLAQGSQSYDDDGAISQQIDDEYEMTDYSSNESSNLGSPVFAWADQKEQAILPFESLNLNCRAAAIVEQKKPTNIFEANHQMAQMASQSTLVFNEHSQGLSAYSTQQTFGKGINSNSQYISSQNFEDTSGFNFYNFLQKKQEEKEMGNEANSQGIQMKGKAMAGENSQDSSQQQRLLGSPQKLRTVKQRKILYCNNKEVPSWAYDLKVVTEKVREQRKCAVMEPHKVFGVFTVENLSLVEVFTNTGRNYDEGRGSSANWRQDYTPEQIENLINATSHTPNRKKQSKFTSFLQNSFNSIKKKLL